MTIEIDRRPIWLLLLRKGARFAFLLGLVLIFWLIIAMPTPVGLTPAGKNAIAIFTVCLFLWISNVIPLAVTSIFAILMVPLFGVLTEKQTFALFGNEAVFFILGAFILAGAMMRSGLSNRITLNIMKRFGGSAKGLIRSIFLIAAFLSFFISEHAVAAMLFPIVIEIAKALNLKPGKSNYGKLLFISLAWGCIIGGVATFLGGARVPLAVGILKETSNATISFLDYTLAVFPIVIVMLTIAYVILVRLFPVDVKDVDEVKGILLKRLHGLGKVTFREYAVGAIMFLTVMAWIFLSRRLGLASIALASVVALFIFKLVRWKDIEEYVNWGIILMYGGAIILGSALDKSGAAKWMASITIESWSNSPWAVVALFSLATLLLTECMSNAAVIAVLMPVGIGIAGSFDMDPTIITLAIAIPAGLAFSLPMSTPANAMAVSSNYVGVKDIAKAGIIMSVLSWVVFNLVARFYWPIIGLNF